MCTERQVTEVEKLGRLVCLCCLFWLLAFTVVPGAVLLYDYDHGQAYGRTLTELAGEEVQGKTCKTDFIIQTLLFIYSSVAPSREMILHGCPITIEWLGTSQLT